MRYNNRVSLFFMVFLVINSSYCLSTYFNVHFEVLNWFSRSEKTFKFDDIYISHFEFYKKKKKSSLHFVSIKFVSRLKCYRNLIKN